MAPDCAFALQRLKVARLSVRCLVVGTIFGAGISGLSSGAFGQSGAQLPPAEVSVLDDVEECDLLAADPSDPQRVSEGVADNGIIPRLAVRACELADRQRPAELRFAFQLARALIASNRATQAKAHLERAASGHYGAAIAALADLRAEAIGTQSASATERLSAARAALREAVAMHDQALRAGYVTSEQRKAALTFDGALYTQPILGQIAEGAFDAARASSQDAAARAYLYAFTTNTLGQCGPVVSALTVAHLVHFRFMRNASEEDEGSTLVSVQPLLGEIDSQRFVRRHGCDGPVPEMFFSIAMPAFFDTL
jgi:hypothetical protein